ncbi:MAG TPA: hypothetical protein VG889_00940 [Rhizomicrobium sp.]|nr:hypothetical protein [Rhizomicrobium sp.]
MSQNKIRPGTRRNARVALKPRQIPHGKFPKESPAINAALDTLAGAPADPSAFSEQEIIAWDTDYCPPSNLLDLASARAECTKIAKRFQDRFERDVVATGLGAVVKKFRRMETLSGELVREFQDMSVDAYRALVGIARFENDDLSNLANAIHSQIDVNRIIPKYWPRGDVFGLSCGVSEDLAALSLYLGALQGHLQGKDKGGNTNVARLISGSPEWALVHDAWRLFRALGLCAQASKDGALDQFVGQIECWVTGRKERSFIEIIKKYRQARVHYLIKATHLKETLRHVGWRRAEDIQVCIDRIQIGRPLQVRGRMVATYEQTALEFLDAHFELVNGFPNTKLPR